ncbi:MAG: hypothetical protein HY363_00025 [Candidatus Aenigmarchaeota archaeon]|nr:hypothetical protein [Candidatus Aenigmarchaeota archaeon]
MDKTSIDLANEEKEEKKIIERFENAFISLHDAFAIEQPPEENTIKKYLNELKNACNELLQIKKRQKKKMPETFQPDISACNLELTRIIRLIESIEQKQEYRIESIDKILEEITKYKKLIENLINKVLKPAARKATTA